jgi:tetratricopeptide (TPR) repeat protein
VQEKEIDWSANLVRHFKKIPHTLINFGPQLRSQGEFMIFNFVRLFSGLVFFASIPSAFAQADDVIAAAIRNEHFVEAKALIEARFKSEPMDSKALFELSVIATNDLVGSDEQQRLLLPRLEACIAAKPKDALCQTAFGNVLGNQGLNNGMMAGMRSIGKIKDAFLIAVSSDPANFDARESLVQFYLTVPGFLGGSVKEANKQADIFALFDPLRAHLLRAEIAAYEEDYARAESELKAVPAHPELPPQLHSQMNDAWQALEKSYFHAKNYAAALIIANFLASQTETPAVAQGHLMIGRIAIAQERWSDAAKEITLAMSLDQWINGHYRLAQALEHSGNKVQAIVEYQRYLQFSPVPTGEIAKDARNRLQALQS